MVQKEEQNLRILDESDDLFLLQYLTFFSNNLVSSKQIIDLMQYLELSEEYCQA